MTESAFNMMRQVKALGKRAADEYAVPYGDVVRHLVTVLQKHTTPISRAAMQHQDSFGMRSSSLGALQLLEGSAASTEPAEGDDARPMSWRERRRNKAK